MDDPVRRQCNEILLWRRGNGGRKPMQTRECCEEGRLAKQQAKLKGRCSKALGTKPSQRQLSQDEVRYYEWCLSDAALHQERPEWMAEVSPTRNTNSGDAHLALVPGVNPQLADARAKHPEAVDSGTSGGGANPAAKKACVAAVVISSGGPQFAATPTEGSIDFQSEGDRKTLQLHVATEIISSGGDSGAEQPSAAVRKKVDDLIAFVTLSRGVLPRRRSDEPCEASLANAYRDLKSRCNGPINGGKSPSELKLTPSEVAYFNHIEEARNRGRASESPGMHRSSVQDNAEVEHQMHELVIAKDEAPVEQGAAYSVQSPPECLSLDEVVSRLITLSEQGEAYSVQSPPECFA